MPRRSLTLLLALAALGTATTVTGAPIQNARHRTDFVGGRVLVALEPDLRLEAGPGGRLVDADARIAAVLARHDLGQGREIGRRRPGTQTRRFFVLESGRADFDPRAAAAELAARPGVRAACPDYRLRLAATIPNDTSLARQWYIQHASDSDVDLPEAWDLQKSNASVVIGIMDTGVDIGHPELINKIWINTAELNNGLDDDGNGLVDDFRGWDFGSGDNDPNPHFVSDAIGVDVGFHGTFCAGLASAATNNTTGIAGAGWNARILPLKISHPDSGLVMSAAAGAFLYAADKEIDVLSMSVGASGEQPGVPEFFDALVDLATNAGVLCVAAAGNDSTNALFYPAASERVLAVAGTDSTNQRAWFSNFGDWVDCAAPGSWIYSTICRNYPFDFTSAFIYILALQWDGATPYMRGDGTSFSAPLVAGIAALVRAAAPGLTPDQVAQHIVNTGDVLPFDQPIGPKVNAFRAVNELTVAAVQPAVSGMSLARIHPNPIGAAGATLHFTLAQAGDVELAIHDAAGRRVRTLIAGARAAGPHAVRWDGAGDGGAALASGVYFARLACGRDVVTRAAVVLR